MHSKRNSVSMFRLPHKSKVNALRIFLRGAISSFPILLLLLAGSPAHAQLNSNIAGVNLAATLATSLRVTASPGLVNFALVPNGTVTGSSVITVNTSWTLNPGSPESGCTRTLRAPPRPSPTAPATTFLHPASPAAPMEVRSNRSRAQAHCGRPQHQTFHHQNSRQ